MKKIFKYLILTIFLSLLFLPFSKIKSQELINENKIGIYFTGVGCPHCAKVSPVLHERVQEGNLIIIEYEIYKNIANSQSLNEYSDNYNLDLGIPQLLFSNNNHQSGDSPILENLDSMINSAKNNEISLQTGKSTTWSELNLNDLKRYPRIYSKDRIAIRESITQLDSSQNELIKGYISNNLNTNTLDGKEITPQKVLTPGGTLNYENAIKVNGWILQWNGDSINSSGTTDNSNSTTEENSEISLGKIISLGLADSINPCALSILALVLISIVTYNPGDKKQILLAGFSFVLAVLIMYFIYGFLIIKAFEVAQSISIIREFLYGDLNINILLGIVAIILGILGLKDYFSYKPGTIGTEMPLYLRPKVAKLIAKVTSPFAAFSIGMFVTLFLLPCTIGPYIILGGLLASDGFIKAIPSLLIYNFIFVLPMLAVIFLVYLGTSRAEDVKDWRDRNVRYMHLVAGILLFIIGILILTGKF